MEELIGKIIGRVSGGKTFSIGGALLVYLGICMFADCYETDLTIVAIGLTLMLITMRAGVNKAKA